MIDWDFIKGVLVATAYYTAIYCIACIVFLLPIGAILLMIHWIWEGF